MTIPAHGTDYEMERQQRIEENRRRMEEMGLLKQKSILDSFRPVKTQQPKVFKPVIRKERHQELREMPRRSSKRLNGEKPDYVEIDDDDRPKYSDVEELVDLMDRKGYRAAASQMTVPPEPSAEALAAIQAARCASQGRGSVYDSAVGITCHFCRQKKLCGEEGCLRCSNRDASQECIGKTACTKCHSNLGHFCRACLLIRYGQTLEEARAAMDAGTWLCPHCYEEEHPHDGWMCNSSICMKRRGLKPTGIAIYDAHERGFKSVAHLLQAQLRKRGPTPADGEASGDSPDNGSSQQESGDVSEAGTEAGSPTCAPTLSLSPQSSPSLGRGARGATRRAAAADSQQQQQEPSPQEPQAAGGSDVQGEGEDVSGDIMDLDVPLNQRRRGGRARGAGPALPPAPAPAGVSKQSAAARSRRAAAATAAAAAVAPAPARLTRSSSRR